jgi:hypothetical protein
MFICICLCITISKLQNNFRRKLLVQFIRLSRASKHSSKSFYETVELNMSPVPYNSWNNLKVSALVFFRFRRNMYLLIIFIKYDCAKLQNRLQ